MVEGEGQRSEVAGAEGMLYRTDTTLINLNLDIVRPTYLLVNDGYRGVLYEEMTTVTI